MTSVPTRQTARARFGSKLLVAILVFLFAISVVGFASAVIDAGDTASPSPNAGPGAATGASVDASADRFRLAVAEASVPPSPSVPSPSASPASQSDAPQLRPIVPVVGFWSRTDGMPRRDIKAALETGKAKGFKRIVVEEGVAAGLASTLNIELHADVRVRDRSRVEAAVAKGGLGFLEVTDVSPRVKALRINGAALFGNDRVDSLDAWPLMADAATAASEDDDGGTGDEDQAPEASGAPEVVPLADAKDDPEAAPRTWDPADTWVLVAGGDSFTDRGVYDNVVNKGRGVDFPFDGGTARVTGHGCCDPVFNDNVVPRYELTGDKGIVRKLFRSAELAIANHEAPVTEGWAFHRRGFRFSGKPELTRVFTRAGIDWVSLANNHIKDYGTDGIADTRRILKKFGIAFSGAGKDLKQARKTRPLDINGTKVTIIPCVGVARAAWAGPKTSGGTPCLDQYIVKDIKKAARTSDVVIVFPHWGVEYTRQPLPSMRKHAARWVKAGADLILGAHSHVAGAIEDIDGSPVLYSLGNLIFDQHWSTNTMESFMLEATFNGDRLVQLRLHPYIVHAQSQPNLLDPRKGEGRRLLKSVRAASRDELDW